tara:strand:- start:846 stop:2039 length:1194 start_codon:yes stop_codon:yes gene_type:complete
MKILVISSRLPFPPIGGDKLRLNSHLKKLRLKNEITLLSLIDESDRKMDFSQIEINSNFKIVTFYKSLFKKLVDSLFYLFFKSLPIQVGYFYSKKIQKWVDQNYKDFDLIICIHVRTTEYIIKYSSVNKKVDLVDLISTNMNRQVKKTNFPKKILYRLEANRLKEYEKNVIENFNISALISKSELGSLSPLLKSKTVQLNNFLNIKSLEENANKNNTLLIKNYIVFFGKMNYKPNLDAINWFIKIFQKLVKFYPDLQLVILGSHAESLKKKFFSMDNVIVTGFVENPYSIISNSVLSIAPMISGSGIQNKILETMAIGKTVVTTEIGAEGLDIENNVHLVVASLDKFLDKLKEYMDDDHKRNYIEKESRKWIINNYNEELYNKQLNLFIHDNIKSPT